MSQNLKKKSRKKDRKMANFMKKVATSECIAVVEILGLMQI